MIPVRLSLLNFMPYRGEIDPIDFSGIHIASICGDNGSGKSSLIDAMTWALWGKTRAKTDDDLIHQNEIGMQVVFDFTVADQLYRVIRKHTRAKSKRSSGQSSLDLFIAHDGNFRPISGDRMTDTENKIVELLHMDYETFVNSAFLRQGHADQFTVARPVERKAVLTNILGLSDYDRLEQRAREFANRCENEKTRLSSNLRDIDDELSRKVSYETELSMAQVRLADIEKILTGTELKLTQFRQERDLLTVKQSQVARLEDQINRMSRDLNRWTEQSKQHSARLKEYERLLENRQNIEQGYARLVDLRKLNDQYTQRLRIVNSLQERQHRLELSIVQSGQILLREHALMENQLADLQARSRKQVSLRADLQKVQFEIDQITGSEAKISAMRNDYQTRLGEVRQLEVDRTRLESEIADISTKLAMLKNEPGARCPLCEQVLGAEHIKLITEKYYLEQQNKSVSSKSIMVEVGRKKSELAVLEREISQTEIQLDKVKTGLQSKFGVLTQELSEAEEAGKQIEGQKEKLAEIEESLAGKKYAREEQAAMHRLDAELTEIAYDPHKHDELRGELTHLAEAFEGPKHKLEEAERLIKDEVEAVSTAEQAVRELQVGLTQSNIDKAGLMAELEKLPSVAHALSEAETEYKSLGQSQKEARETLGSTREKLNRCAQLEAVRTEKESLLKQTVAEEGIYHDLAEAFGKRGVQALLIELALPEIEDEANRLLSRMTDNRLHVKFETQRETRKGDLLETLDINIADELGTRSYEMFSGGEAFRINFAIRVALSKVLARRAGAPLPTLIVDEGFGTQDANGMEKLKEAITSVQDDFEKILVITHIEDFRDAFPVRIDVVKGPHGSTVEIN